MEGEKKKQLGSCRTQVLFSIKGREREKGDAHTHTHIIGRITR